MIEVAREEVAWPIMDVLPKRMSKYGLTVHPAKTPVVRFDPPQTDRSQTEERATFERTTLESLGYAR